MGFSNHVHIPLSSSSLLRGETRGEGGVDETAHEALFTSSNDQIRLVREIPASFVVRMAMRVSRAKWFTFLRRVFHYQNGSRSHLGENPFNSCSWMMLEFLALVIQICVTLITLCFSKEERPVWPMRIWIVGYDFGCVMNLFILYWRYRHYHLVQGNNGLNILDLEQQRNNEEPRGLHLVNRCRASLDLFFAMWFVMGNVWVFDSRFGSFNRAPKLHILCIIILSWNAITYSFPFLLFLLLCICVPLISSFIGYNMNLGSAEKGASDDQISQLHCWRYKLVETSLGAGNSSPTKDNPECCICLTKYKDKEEIRQLPCSHIFHKKCVDQWLRIISCCPLCKQCLD
ncbi:E3 ubiquitin-protein ligase At4g11680-like [Chenopodium quinoa]|uniref:E3 ubiquitin-protein ligase At4g11680-like n=1 Tax=Chenopodium quinoa TaxID=63459 RepID=UPI000B785EC8|nr:E3 ubiquitin-protein ligase At4g11680-like [Chenopodium quinoa]